MPTPSIFSFIKEASGGTTVIENGTEHFFGSNFSPHFKAKGNLLSITIDDCEFKVLNTDTINVDPGSGSSVFSGTVSQLKQALIPVFIKPAPTGLTTAVIGETNDRVFVTPQQKASLDLLIAALPDLISG